MTSQADDYDAAQPDPRKPERGPGRPTQEAEGKTGHIHIRLESEPTFSNSCQTQPLPDDPNFPLAPL
jgi:hypothetical protein